MEPLLIQNGTIIDGTGNPGFKGHLLIEGKRIREVIRGGENPPQAGAILDASGQIVAPGFIDMHSHSDWAIPLPDHDIPLKCLLEQGITTIVGGNCGFSPAPISHRTRRLLGMDHFNLMIDKPLDYSWNSMSDFLEKVKQARPIVNTAHLVGHGSIRFAQADTRRGKLTEDELDNCLDMLLYCLDEGACGLSFGLGYDPGMYSPAEEIEAFCKIAAMVNKPVTVHLKALSRISPTYPLTYLKAHNVRALAEMIRIAQKTGAALQVSHLVFVGKRSWPTAEKCLKMIETARKDGIDIMFDAFPYTCGNTTVNVVLPYWFLAKLPAAYRSWWSKFHLRVELAAGFALLGFSYKDFQLMDAGPGGWHEFNGHRFLDIARGKGLSAFNTVLSLSEISSGQAVVLLHTYSGEPGNEKVLDAVLSNDLCLFETDALTRFGGHPNPAALGTFPKILGHYVRDRNLIPLENAVRRMTGASAERFLMKDRGVLAAGKKADIVVFDPDSIAETPAVDAKPAGRPKGISHVFINGAHAVKDGNYITDVRAGEVIRV
ncbi:MAG: amidohydrolase family protein [Desulfobacterales bacterium]|jgi:N-acyl-D-amino-acid deacylase|nr:amidohydrolase family protein [Desulfobacterales bacterium]